MFDFDWCGIGLCRQAGVGNSGELAPEEKVMLDRHQRVRCVEPGFRFAFPYHRELARLCIRHRFQEEAINDGEYSRVSSDGKSQHDADGNCITRPPHEPA